MNAKNEADFYYKFHGLLKNVLNMSDAMASEEIARLIDDEGFFPKRPGQRPAVNMIEEFKRNFFGQSESQSIEQIMNDSKVKNRPITKEYAEIVKAGMDKQNEYARLASRRTALRSIIREILKRRYGLKVYQIFEAYFNGSLSLEGIDIMYSIEPFPKMLPFGSDADNPGNLVKDPDEYQEEFDASKLEYARKMVGESWRQPTDWYEKYLFYLGTLYKTGNRVKTYSYEEQKARVAALVRPLEDLYKQQDRILEREEKIECLKSA
jgi:hypothetical protein